MQIFGACIWKKVIILLDEYDTPMQEAYVYGYWEEMTSFLRNLFNATFKTNKYCIDGLPNRHLTKECDCMKKLIALVLAMVCVLGLVGCNNRSMNYIISNEPSITGIVKETNEDAILIENDNGEYWVSLNVENKDSMTSFNIGDEIVVYYDGNIAESYPMQINTVYAITLKTPADRAENDKS